MLFWKTQNSLESVNCIPFVNITNTQTIRSSRILLRSTEEMNYRRKGNESRGVHASDPLLETERSNIVVKYKCPFCRHVMAVGEALHAEHGQLLCPKCVTRITRYSLFFKIDFIKFYKVTCFHDSC